jgi:hypothetical protein
MNGGWASGAILFDTERLFVFGCATFDLIDDTGHFDAKLAALACVRAKEIGLQGGAITSLLAVGHIVGDGFIDYRYIYMEPPVDVPAELLQTVRQEHGSFNLEKGEVSSF